MRKPSPSSSPPQVPSSVWPALIVQRVAGPPRQSGQNQAVTSMGKSMLRSSDVGVTCTLKQPLVLGCISAPVPLVSSPTAKNVAVGGPCGSGRAASMTASATAPMNASCPGCAQAFRSCASPGPVSLNVVSGASTPNWSVRAGLTYKVARVDQLEQSARKSGCLHPHEGSEVSMAGSYSTDLRERVLAAVEAGAAPEAAARRFAVGRSTAYRWAREARTEGRRAARRMGGGPKPRIAGEVEAALLGLLAGANHLTLAECRDRLAARTGVWVHPWTVGRALRRCGRT